MKFIKKENQVKPIKTAGRKQHKLAYKAWVKFIIMAARLFFFRRDICPRPECALLDNLPIVSFSLSEKTVSQNRFFLFASEDIPVQLTSGRVHITVSKGKLDELSGS